MTLSGTKKSPLSAVPFLKKRLRRITALGLYNLTVNEFYFSVHFTLHRNEKTIAFYTSEPIVNQRSPEWTCFEFPTNVQCLQEFLIRVWITSENTSRLFLEYDVHLDDSLIPDEQKKNVTKDNNCLWLELFGYRFTDNDGERIVQENEDEIALADKKKRTLSTKSYNKLSIIRMNNIIQAIRNEEQSVLVYSRDLQNYVDEHNDFLSKIKERETRELRIDNLRNHLEYQTDLYEQRLNANQQRKKNLAERRNQLNQNLLRLKDQQQDISSYRNKLDKFRSILHNLTQIISYRQKEIMNEIYRYIYPINYDNQNEYYIANIKLPQADDKIYQSPLNRDHDHDIATAVGYCSHLILIISQIIQLPLRFPIDYHGASTIKIYDYTLDISEFSLYPTTNLSSFRYAFYLLNRNVGQIMFHCQVGHHHTDFRNTLENLKDLIEEYFINAIGNKQISLYPALEEINSTNKKDESFSDENKVVNVSSVFLSSCSSTSSLIEDYDYDQVEDMEIFSEFKPNKPRLSMQISHQ